MRLETLLKSALMLLVVLLAVVITSWVGSESREARAEGGGGANSGNWMMVSSELRPGEGLIYMFNTEKEVLLVYAFHRGRRTDSNRLFTGDLQFLSGRHCKWDLLYCTLIPYPKELPKSDMHTPGQVKRLYDEESKNIPK